MKVFAFIFIVVSLAAEITSSESEDVREVMLKWVEDCGTELNIPKEKMDEYQTVAEPPDGRMASCLIACIFEKTGVMKDEKLVGDVITAVFGEIEDEEEMENLEKIAKRCQEKASIETEKCDVAGTFTKCIYLETHA